MNTECEKIGDHLPALAAGLLEPDRATAVRVHVRDCASCAAELEIVQALQALSVTVPADLVARVEHAVATKSGSAAGAGAAVADGAEVGIGAGTRPRTQYYAAAAVLACALFGSLIAIQQLQPTTDVMPADSVVVAEAESPLIAPLIAPLAQDALVGAQAAVSELDEAQLEALLSEMES